MNVVALPKNSIRVGVPMPFAVRDAQGHLLVARGAVIKSEAQRKRLMERGIYVDESEAEPFLRALSSKLDNMVRRNATLGQIARATADSNAIYATPDKPTDPLTFWTDIQFRANALLREPGREDFLPRLLRLQQDILDQVNRDPDIALFILLQATSTEPRWYSATHALVVTVICELAARHITHWPESVRLSLRCIALTKNVAMTELQDQLSQQEQPPSERQRELIDGHAKHGVVLLRNAGVEDTLWLEAVGNHHSAPPGSLTDMTMSMQLARLVQRADIFSARMSPRAKRRILSATAAAQAAYLDEDRQPDEAGAAVIKGTGLYPPGSYVRLKNCEIAVALRRGSRATEPLVVSIVGKDGLPLGVPTLRDTLYPQFAITGAVAPHEVKVHLNVEKLLKLR